jgi:hypothetical protein
MPGAAWLLSTIMLLGATVLMLRVTGAASPETSAASVTDYGHRASIDP